MTATVQSVDDRFTIDIGGVQIAPLSWLLLNVTGCYQLVTKSLGDESWLGDKFLKLKRDDILK